MDILYKALQLKRLNMKLCVGVMSNVLAFKLGTLVRNVISYKSWSTLDRPNAYHVVKKDITFTCVNHEANFSALCSLWFN